MIEKGEINISEMVEFIYGVENIDAINSEDFESQVFTDNIKDILMDFDIVKIEGEYYLEIETIYSFESYELECEYLKNCLEVFTRYMIKNSLSMSEIPSLFLNNLRTKMKAKSIEELYTNFKIYVNGFCSLGEN